MGPIFSFVFQAAPFRLISVFAGETFRFKKNVCNLDEA